MPGQAALNVIGLDPAEILLAAIIHQAIHDASQSRDPRLKAEALAFLWEVAPVVAGKLKLPAPAWRVEIG